MDPFIGQIQAFGFNFPPRGWAFCDGQLLSISQNAALFSLLGTTYGGDGRTTFALPDLRGRSIVHAGQGPGLNSITQGEREGSENIILTVNNLPAHNHNVSVAVNSGSGEESSSTSYLASHANAFSEVPTSDAVLAGVNQTNVGGNQPVNIRNPFLGIYVCIALQGIFPSRQ
jgi:microcystin-dependent protein